MRIALTAPTGMLGSMVYRELAEHHDLVLVYQDARKLHALDAAYGGVQRHRAIAADLTTLADDYRAGFSGDCAGPRTQALLDAIGSVDLFFHCAGVTNRYAAERPLETFFLNSALPHLLSRIYRERLVHITTDCVYSGIAGAPYDEDALKTPTDFYGLTKSIGEPSDMSLVFRTSFIGPEICDGVALLSWFFAQTDKTIHGYTNHWWNGMTTLALARIYARIAADRSAFPATGLFHLFGTDITKHDLLVQCKERWGVRVTIEPKEATPIDRRLATQFDLCTQLAIPPLDMMLDALAAFPIMRELPTYA
ncbi:MAG: sugar nucleotide-binding protein [bacterium]|nr:sugar nucleotide-binding protein [bacterium]